MCPNPTPGLIFHNYDEGLFVPYPIPKTALRRHYCLKWNQKV